MTISKMLRFIALHLVILFNFANGFLLKNETGLGTIVKQKGCPDGWTRYDLHCYHYSSSRQTWTTAEATCKQFDGHLAVKEDSFIERFIKRFLTLTRNDAHDWTFNYTWIGASDLAKEGNWLWITGKTLGMYTNWRAPSLNNGFGQFEEDSMDWSFRGWNDFHCASRLNFVCEKRAMVNVDPI